MAIRDKMTANVTPYLQPGETVQGGYIPDRNFVFSL